MQLEDPERVNEELVDFPERVSPPGWKDTVMFTVVPIIGLAQLLRGIINHARTS
ncbi:hypothetical protein HYT74_02755 [Candidatus Daviesbacteria bacterium]|nr:hypothetical protein [Candidatus Daviesbacteria bacterium]